MYTGFYIFFSFFPICTSWLLELLQTTVSYGPSISNLRQVFLRLPIFLHRTGSHSEEGTQDLLCVLQ